MRILRGTPVLQKLYNTHPEVKSLFVERLSLPNADINHYISDIQSLRSQHHADLPRAIAADMTLYYETISALLTSETLNNIR